MNDAPKRSDKIFTGRRLDKVFTVFLFPIKALFVTCNRWQMANANIKVGIPVEIRAGLRLKGAGQLYRYGL